LKTSRLVEEYLQASELFQEHLKASRNCFESFWSFHIVLEASEIFLDYFRNIWKFFGQFKEHIEDSELL